MRFTFLMLLGFIVLVSCQNDSAKATETPAAKPAKETIKPPTKYVLTPFAPSKAFTDAKIESMDYTDGKFSFKVGGNYELGTQTPDAPSKMCANSGKGQHIHLIMDTAPYAAKYVADFDHEVANGDHHLLAFLSRSYHESIKSKGAHVALKTKVENGTITAREPITEPTLFYSRPKGTYVGAADTKKIMLDFFLVNATLGADYKVQAKINGEMHLIDTWKPYYIEGLPMGENTITLTLLDKDGKKVNSPINPVTRKFVLKTDPTEG